jgi:hypothetical protein
MKSARPQGYRFSWRSHRSGRQTRSEVICLTPSRFRLLQNCDASRPCFCLAASGLFLLYAVAPSLWVSMFLKRRLKRQKVSNEQLAGEK